MSLVNESQTAVLNNMFLQAYGRSPSAAEFNAAAAQVPHTTWEDINARIRAGSFLQAPQSFAAAPGFESQSFIGGLVGAIGGAAKGLVTGGVTGAIAGGVRGAVTGSRGGPPSVARPTTSALVPVVPGAGTITRTVGAGLVGGLVGGLTGGSSCGCNGSNGRDPCTRQKMSGQRAPEATFFGGCCPPGRVLRRRPWARDICAKTPRMNVFNPRALARADRRVTGFARRAAPILRDLGFQVSTATRRPKGLKKKRRR